MTTDQASAIQREVDQLIDLQIATMRQKSPLTSAHLFVYQLRSVKMAILYKELDRIKRTELVMKFAKAS